MKVFAVLAVFLPLVFCADPDPTTVCFPDRFESSMYDFNTNMFSSLSIDFIKKLIAIVSEKSTIVEDLNNAKEYISDSATGSCISGDMPPSNIVTKCLPASATLDGTFTVGLGATALQVQAWSFHRGSGIIRFDLLQQPNQPFIPLVVQFEENSVLSNEFYFNTTIGISDESVFSIPSVCPPATAV